MHADAFPILNTSSQLEPNVTLCYHCMQTLEIVQTNTAWAHTQLDFPMGQWTWVVKSIKQSILAEKIARKCWNSQNRWLKSLHLGSFMKKVTKSLFSFPVY